MDKNIKAFEENAELLKVLAHPVRLCIIKGLLEKGECNVTYMQNCLQVPQSTISQHLQRMRAGHIIEGERNGLEINYRVCDERVAEIIKVLFNEEK